MLSSVRVNPMRLVFGTCATDSLRATFLFLVVACVTFPSVESLSTAIPRHSFLQPSVHPNANLEAKRTSLREQMQHYYTREHSEYIEEEVECMEFVISYMPQRDFEGPEKITWQYLLAQTRLALKARNATAFSRSVPWEMFKNDVLPYAVLGEPRDDWRALFTDKFGPLVKHAASITEAAQTLNKHIWGLWTPNILFVPDQTPKIMSPFEVIKHRQGMSIFLVDALRSVGVPARAVGTARWNNTEGGNHCWVEFWDQTWSFTGAAEYNALLNNTWFFPYPAKLQRPGSELCNGSAIYASSWAPTPDRTFFPLYWQMNQTTGECLDEARYVPGFDVTKSYLDEAAKATVNRLVGEPSTATVSTNAAASPAVPILVGPQAGSRNETDRNIL